MKNFIPLLILLLFKVDLESDTAKGIPMREITASTWIGNTNNKIDKIRYIMYLPWIRFALNWILLFNFIFIFSIILIFKLFGIKPFLNKIYAILKKKIIKK